MSPEDCNRRLMLDNFHAAGCFISSDNQLPFIKQLNQLWTHLSVELNLQPLTKMPRRRCWTLDATCFTSWARFRTGTNSKGLKLHDLRSGQIPDVEIKKKKEKPRTSLVTILQRGQLLTRVRIRKEIKGQTSEILFIRYAFRFSFSVTIQITHSCSNSWNYF